VPADADRPPRARIEHLDQAGLGRAMQLQAPFAQLFGLARAYRLGQRAARNGTKVMLDERKELRGLHITDDDQRAVIRA